MITGMNLMKPDISNHKLKTGRSIFFFRLFFGRTECIGYKLKVENSIRHQSLDLQCYIVQLQITDPDLLVQESEHADVHFNLSSGYEGITGMVFQINILENDAGGKINVQVSDTDFCLEFF